MSSYLKDKYPPGNEHIPAGTFESMMFFFRRWDTVDGRNPANQLSLLVIPLFTKVSYIPGGCLGISSINRWFPGGYPNSHDLQDLCAMYRQKLIQVLPKEKLSTDIGRIKYGQTNPEKMCGVEFMFAVHMASWCGNWVRYWRGWKIFRWDSSSHWMAPGDSLQIWPKWSRFFQKHLHPSAASDALARVCLHRVRVDFLERPRFCQSFFFLNFGEPFLVGCCS